MLKFDVTIEDDDDEQVDEDSTKDSAVLDLLDANRLFRIRLDVVVVRVSTILDTWVDLSEMETIL